MPTRVKRTPSKQTAKSKTSISGWGMSHLGEGCRHRRAVDVERDRLRQVIGQGQSVGQGLGQDQVLVPFDGVEHRLVLAGVADQDVVGDLEACAFARVLQLADDLASMPSATRAGVSVVSSTTVSC